MKAFDAGFLSLLFRDDVNIPADPETQKPVDRPKERIEELVRVISSTRERILVPTPALSEFLVIAGSDGPTLLQDLHGSSVYRIASFDERAAVEAAAQTAKALAAGDKKGGSQSTWQKVKVDRQIVAIAIVNGADTLYSTDSDIKTLGENIGLTVLMAHELPDPPPTQILLTYEKKEAAAPTESEPAELSGGGDGPTQGQAPAEGEEKAESEETGEPESS